MCNEGDIRELLDRTRRLESRLVQFGDFVGANLRTKQRIEVAGPPAAPHVLIDALDVSVSRIVTELRQHNVRHGEVPVYLNGELVFAINLDNCR